MPSIRDQYGRAGPAAVIRTRQKACTSASNEDYLIHYGVAGMKWGIRRYVNPDGTLTDEGKKHYGVGSKMARLYSKEARKLEKYSKNADAKIQQENAEKYTGEAKKIGKVTAALGTAAVVGVSGIRKAGSLYLSKRSQNNDNENAEQDQQLNENLNRKSVKIATRVVNTALRKVKPVVGAAAAVTGVAAGVKSIQAAVAKRRASGIGHDQAVIKYQLQIQRMNKMFGDTQYSKVLKAQVEQYKKEHPNTKLSNSEIMDNLT